MEVRARAVEAQHALAVGKRLDDFGHQAVAGIVPERYGAPRLQLLPGPGHAFPRRAVLRRARLEQQDLAGAAGGQRAGQPRAQHLGVVQREDVARPEDVHEAARLAEGEGLRVRSGALEPLGKAGREFPPNPGNHHEAGLAPGEGTQRDLRFGEGEVEVGGAHDNDRGLTGGGVPKGI